MALSGKAIRDALREEECELDEDALEMLLEASQMHKMGASKLRKQFEVFQLNRGANWSNMDTARARDFCNYLQSKLTKEDERRGYTSPATTVLPEDMTGVAPSTPAPAKTPNASSAAYSGTERLPSEGTPFSKRQRRRESSCELEPQVPMGQHESGEGRVDVRGSSEMPPADRLHGRVYFGERLEDRARAQEERMREFKRAIEEAEGQSFSDAVNSPSQATLRAVGRVVPENDPEPMDEASVLIEGSFQDSGGARVRLNLDRMATFSLFPGQVLALEGFNPTGWHFVAERIVSSIPPPPRSLPANEHSRQAISIIAAAGPFTCSSDLVFEPLQELVEYAKEAKPDIVAFVGPFVDVNHPRIRDGIEDMLDEDIFEERIVPALRSLRNEAGARVIVTPSLRDAHALPVLPQPSLQLPHEVGQDSCVISLPNPSHAEVNELSICAMGSEPIKHMSPCELRRPKRGSGDKMARMAHSLIGQRTVTPLFPPAPSAPVDCSLAEYLAFPSLPDILLAPSDLAPFAKSIANGQWVHPAQEDVSEEGRNAHSVVVNPGRLAKGPQGGTFARLTIAPSPHADSDSSEQLTRIGERTRVDIIRI